MSQKACGFIFSLSFPHFSSISVDISLIYGTFPSVSRDQTTRHMPGTPLQNYLRTCRKKAALSQEEASRLVGLKNRLQFARYERHQSEPPLEVALACEQICNIPTAELFAGVSTTVAKRTRKRVRAFERGLTRGSTAATPRRLHFKLQWTVACLARLMRHIYGT